MSNEKMIFEAGHKANDIISFMYNGIKREEVVEFRAFSFTVGLSLNFTLNFLVENNIELEIIGNHKTTNP